MDFSTAFFATLQTFFLAPKNPFADFNILFLRDLALTLLVDLGIL